MKIAVCSDLHLEFGAISLKNDDNVDVLVLSGDICVGNDLHVPDMYSIIDSKKMLSAYTFFAEVCERFPHVVYIMGNHEHYHGDFAKTFTHIKSMIGNKPNLHMLDKSSVVIDDVTFVGGTLWTDMNKQDPLTMSSMLGTMNDYRTCKNSNFMLPFKRTEYGTKENGFPDYDNIIGHIDEMRPSSLLPEHTVAEHKATLHAIKTVVESDPLKKYVVVGHHAPSKLSTKPRYEGEYLMNGAYSSDLSEFILDHPQIKLWTHGHTHNNFDYMLGSTRIFCNPRGYDGYEDCADKFKLLFVEI